MTELKIDRQGADNTVGFVDASLLQNFADQTGSILTQISKPS